MSTIQSDRCCVAYEIESMESYEENYDSDGNLLYYDLQTIQMALRRLHWVVMAH